MYKQFYGLSRNPFEIGPNPYFFYPTMRHNEALACLTYGVHNRKGFVVVTGEVGTGKTLLVRFLLEGLHNDQIPTAFVYNPNMSVLEFLAHVLTDLQITFSEKTKAEMLSRLNEYLIASSGRGNTTALVIDEAQLLSCELLEEIRLLTNLETSQYKLLQIVLVGQPELDKKLDSLQLRQLKQRIGLRCRLQPLGLDELRGYIHHRLELAGANSHAATIFPDETISIIQKHSRGIPRLVNTLCENSLISGFTKQVKQITAEIVEEVAESFRLNVITEVPGQASSDRDLRKKVLQTVSQLIEEIGGASERRIDESSWISGRKEE